MVVELSLALSSDGPFAGCPAYDPPPDLPAIIGAAEHREHPAHTTTDDPNAIRVELDRSVFPPTFRSA